VLLVTVVASCGDEATVTIGSSEYAYQHPPPSSPQPWTYFLTSYGGPNDSCYLGTPACGGKVVDGKWWYSTGAYSFGCNSKLKLCANGKCAVVNVVDNGPASWVEAKAQATCGGTGYIIDASPVVSQHLFGTSSAGWSDCLAIQVETVDASTPDGPYTASPPPPPPPPEPPPECDYGTGNNLRKCNACGAQQCLSDGTWATDCVPSPLLYPCPSGQTCDNSANCVSGPPPSPPPTPSPPTANECDPNSANNRRRCVDCGVQHCLADGTWSKSCTPNPTLFPCPAGQYCDASARCLSGPPPPTPPSGGADPYPDPPGTPAAPAPDTLQGGCSVAPTADAGLPGVLLLLALTWATRQRRV
jgi:hypothetical protein